MNIEKMKAFAQAQRESEESMEIRPAPKPAEPEYQPEAIYIPIEDDEPSEIPDDGFAAVSNEEEPELPETETIEEIIAKCFPEDKSYNIELDRLLPLRSPIFTDGGDLSELSSSIARMGITKPLLVRSAGNGEYEILSGNRRRTVAEQLMWVKVPCRIGDGKLITDEYAKRIIVETNRQRFPELTLSENIKVSAVLGERAEKELGITSEQSKLYSRLNALEQEFLLMLDSGAVRIADAVILCGIEDRAVLLDAQRFAIHYEYPHCLYNERLEYIRKEIAACGLDYTIRLNADMFAVYAAECVRTKPHVKESYQKIDRSSIDIPWKFNDWSEAAAAGRNLPADSGYDQFRAMCRDSVSELMNEISTHTGHDPALGFPEEEITEFFASGEPLTSDSVDKITSEVFWYLYNQEQHSRLSSGKPTEIAASEQPAEQFTLFSDNEFTMEEPQADEPYIMTISRKRFFRSSQRFVKCSRQKDRWFTSSCRSQSSGS